MVGTDNSSERFYVQTSSDESSGFVNRQKSVFEKLDAVVQKNETIIKALTTPKRKSFVEVGKAVKKQRFDTRQFQGKESIFKRPEAPPPARFSRSLPAYVRNPEKWTKYTLGDVSQEDMSDRSNTAAALSFLKELKAKKEAEGMDVDSESSQITFKKPYNSREQEINSTACTTRESPSFRSSKLVMPEYVVGEKKKFKRAVSKTAKSEEKTKAVEIKLNHLLEEDDY